MPVSREKSLPVTEYGVDGRIISQNKSYRFSCEDIEVDAFKLEKIADEWFKNGVDKTPSLEEFKSFYPGNLLDEKVYEWAEELRAFYLRVFVNSGKLLVDKFIEKGVSASIIFQFINHLVQMDPYNEDLREKAIGVLYEAEGKKALIDYYLKFEALLESEIGFKPRTNLMEAYKRLMNIENG